MHASQPRQQGRFCWPARGRGLQAARPACGLQVAADDPAGLAALPDTVSRWFGEGIELVAGALAYEAGGILHGTDCARPAGTPLAVLQGYREYGPWRGVDHTPGHWQLTAPFQPEWQKADYRRALAGIQRYLLAGDCYQVNLSQRFRARYRGDPLAGWQQLFHRHPSPFAAFLEWDGMALLSVSPERFLQIRDGNVVTEPIKGSRPRGASPAEDEVLGAQLRNSAKDRAENLMIVDLLRNDLGHFCRPGSIRVPELFGLRRFSNVQHLVSTVEGRLRDGVTPLAALLDSFPGGSITGAPKKRAMEVIAELEPVPRGFYCGSLFYQTADGDFDSSILIRTLQAHADGTLDCHGGGGIVTDSDPEAEYEESLFKVRALMEAVGAGR